jgi:hypothetical protein
VVGFSGTNDNHHLFPLPVQQADIREPAVKVGFTKGFFGCTQDPTLGNSLLLKSNSRSQHLSFDIRCDVCLSMTLQGTNGRMLDVILHHADAECSSLVSDCMGMTVATYHSVCAHARPTLSLQPFFTNQDSMWCLLVLPICRMLRVPPLYGSGCST